MHGKNQLRTASSNDNKQTNRNYIILMHAQFNPEHKHKSLKTSITLSNQVGYVHTTGICHNGGKMRRGDTNVVTHNQTTCNKRLIRVGQYQYHVRTHDVELLQNRLCMQYTFNYSTRSRTLYNCRRVQEYIALTKINVARNAWKRSERWSRQTFRVEMRCILCITPPAPIFLTRHGHQLNDRAMSMTDSI
jgi:hypothetical protein